MATTNYTLTDVVTITLNDNLGTIEVESIENGVSVSHITLDENTKESQLMIQRVSNKIVFEGGNKVILTYDGTELTILEL
jgi:hypothetical protein